MIGVTFLSLNKKVTKEVSPRGRFEQMRPPWISPRRFAGSAEKIIRFFTVIAQRSKNRNIFAALRI